MVSHTRTSLTSFCRAMLCISAVYAFMRCLSVCHVGGSPSGSHTILVFPYQTGWRYSDGNPPDGGVECRWGIGRNGDSGLIAGYRRLLDVRSAKNIYRRRSWVGLHMTQSATHHWLSVNCWTCELRSDKNSYRRPCSVDRTVGDSPGNVCLWRPAAWTNTPKRREQKRI